ncbi:MAG: hypothetical protein AB7P99_06750 [Vicinamibacterales bacterium]
MEALDQTFTPPADIDARRSRALIVGGVGLAACALGFVIDRDHFFRAWLVSYMLVLGIALGSLALMMIQHLSGGTWGVFRRIFEASSRTLPLLAVLFLPILLGLQSLFPWAHPDLVASDEILNHRSPYLNLPFWLGRAALYFAGWITLSLLLNKWSRQQDNGEVGVNMSIQRLSGFGLVFYAITVTFAGIDWIMALNPHWFSTLFGFLMMGGQGLSALAFTVIVARFLVGRAPMAGFLKPQHFHDLGKLMLAFVMLWAYFNFSQYLLTYAANLAEEVPYMVTRTSNGWQILALALVIFHFAAPFLLLLSRDLKRMPHQLVILAVWLLVMRYTDLFMMISPEFDAAGPNLHLEAGEHASHLFVHWLDLAAPLGIGGLWLWHFYTQLKQRPLLAVGDPYLRESLETAGGH